MSNAMESLGKNSEKPRMQMKLLHSRMAAVLIAGAFGILCKGGAPQTFRDDEDRHNSACANLPALPRSRKTALASQPPRKRAV